jgi:hypothetical protein
MEISLNGFNESIATFEAEEGVTAGMPVKITGNGKVGKCGKSDNFCGIAVNVRDEFAAVQLGGYVRLPYAESTPPKIGYQGIGCADDTKIEAEENGRIILITDIDTVDKTCGMIL